MARATLLTLAVIILLARPADAQTPAPSGPPPSEQPGPTEDPTGPPPTDPTTGQPPLLDELIEIPDELLSGPSDAPIEIFRYDIGYNPDLQLNFDIVLAGMTNFVFAAAGWGVALVVWVLDWVFSFGIGRTFGTATGALAETLGERLIKPLNLVQTGLLGAVAWSGWQAVRNRAARGLAEFGVSLLIAGLGAVALDDPGAATCAGLRMIAGLSGEVLAIAAGGPEAEATDVDGCSDDAGGRYRAQLRPFARAIAESLVVEPALLLNWGTIPQSPCRADADQAARSGPWGGRDERREALARIPECYPLTEFNSQPSLQRLAGAFLVLLAVLFVGGTTLALSFTIAVAQIIGLLLMTVGPLALAIGIVPGTGRQLLIRWLTGLARVVMAVLASAGLLAFLVVLWDALLDLTEGQPLLLTCLLLCATCGATFVVRRRLLIAGHRFAIAHGEKHEDRYGPRWLGFGDPSGDTGFSLHRLGSPGYTHVDALRPHEVVHATFTRNRLAQARAAAAAVHDTAVQAGVAFGAGVAANAASTAISRGRGS